MVMRIRPKAFALALPLTLLAAAGLPAMAAQELEKIISSEPAPTGITVTVATGGCTEKADFQVSSSPGADGKTSIELKRTKADSCKGNFPDGLKLHYTWAELKLPDGTQVAVKNPADPVFGAIPPTVVAAAEVKAAPRHYYRARRHRHRQGWHGSRQVEDAGFEWTAPVRHRHRHFHRHHRDCYCPCFDD
jgi:Fe-S cluster assembly iron-binding protein IscA